ncbi:3-hydroxyacyl-CoA dehydrogenase NAD-binding domain-containing protein [Novosphingobium sp. BL-52-GroH]|uniref:3-hydroxyacyl-CoA dehydrogenase NAD-binding domain-containing protein n=1 Tax=Novosphingobium sp. BL-52-GroH TaxID=3349877 RepID=UPI00384AC0CA
MAKQGRVAVIGAGLMGHGIAHAFASAGYETALVDVDAAAADRGRAKIADILAGGVKLGKMAQADADRALARLSVSTDLIAASTGAVLVVETAVEDITVKLDILSRVDKVVASDAIIATNTSALSVTEIAGACADPSRVVGMHFFNPVHKMKLLEIVSGLETSVETVERARAYGETLAKQVIVVNDSPGLTTSRVSAMMGNEAMWMVYEGVATPEDVDTAHRLAFNHPMGPLELGDLTGWDTRLRVIRYLHSTLGEKFRPCPLIVKMVSSGRYGRKTGAGVYRYETDGAKIPGSGIRASNF